MNYGDIKRIDVANGPGIRVSLFVSGCTHHCKGCFNPETWDFNYGNFFSEKEEDLIIEYLKPSYIKGLSLLGGEPFEYSNQQCLLPLLRRVRAIYPEKDIWCYTGYDFEKDIKGSMMVKWPETREILNYIDILVDGEFVESKKDLSLRFRGSSNQRIINVKASLASNELVLWDQEGRIES
ncbi:MAG: anaerobic ribonucleoside-triphosphate reductase activating protein [Eubacteriales bacterium]|nr:anaerobic ribonucleoside-triphosphate reductase activating protein [Lachnospiraceae bacterium]MDO5126425.1 anaerobic ribonucleoside-triphosphate reductase activating protein [Eubacteriales bacterium]